MLKHVVDVFCISVIITVIFRIPNRPSIHTVNASLRPPPVEDRTVWNTIHCSLHTRCTRCFHRTDWIVQPNVNTAGHHQSGMHVVILDERNWDFVGDLVCRFEDVTNQLFPTFVSRVRFSRENELNLSCTNCPKSLQIFEDQVCSFVGCKSTCKTNG